MQIRVKRINNYLIGMDEFQEEEILSIPQGKEIAITIEEVRNPGNHRRFFAFLNIALGLQDHYQNIDQLRFALFIKAGHCEKVISHKNGSVAFIPKSMNFNKMGEEKFRKVFKDCLNAFHDMLLDMNRPISEQELCRLMDFE